MAIPMPDQNQQRQLLTARHPGLPHLPIMFLSIGPVQEKETIASVAAIKKIPANITQSRILNPSYWQDRKEDQFQINQKMIKQKIQIWQRK